MAVPPPRQLPARIGMDPLCVITTPPSRYQADSMSPSIWVIWDGSGFRPFSNTTTLLPACASAPATTPPPAPEPQTTTSQSRIVSRLTSTGGGGSGTDAGNGSGPGEPTARPAGGGPASCG